MTRGLRFLARGAKETKLAKTFFIDNKPFGLNLGELNFLGCLGEKSKTHSPGEKSKTHLLDKAISPRNRKLKSTIF